MRNFNNCGRQRRAYEKMNLGKLLKEVARIFHLSPDEISGKSRKEHISAARATFIYLARFCDPEEVMGTINRDRSTFYSFSKVKEYKSRYEHALPENKQKMKAALRWCSHENWMQ